MCPTVDGSRFQWRLAPAEGIPLSDNSAQVVLALDVLDHVSNLDATFKELYRILTPGGTLAIGKDASIGDESNTELHLQCARSNGLVVHSLRKLTNTDDNDEKNAGSMNLVIVKKK